MARSSRPMVSQEGSSIRESSVGMAFHIAAIAQVESNNSSPARWVPAPDL